MKFICCLLSFLFVLASCDDSPVRPLTENEADFFPLYHGNYWVYDSYYEDKEPTIDSIAVVSSLDYFSRNAFLLVHYQNGQPFDTLYYNKSGDSLNMYFSDDDNYFLFPVRNWFNIADFSKNKGILWNLYTYHSRNEPYLFNNEVVSLNTDFTVNSNLESMDSIQIGMQNKALGNRYRVKFDSQVYFFFLTNAGNDSVKVIRHHDPNAQRNEYYTFVKNVGIAKIEKKTYSIVWRSDPAHEKFPYERRTVKGYVRYLKRFNVYVPALNASITEDNFKDWQ